MAVTLTTNATISLGASSSVVQSIRGIGIRRIQDESATPTIDKLGNLTSLGDIDVNILNYVTNPYAHRYVEVTTGTTKSAASNGPGSVVSGSRLTEFRKNAGSPLVSNKDLGGIGQIPVTPGGLKKRMAVKNYNLLEQSNTAPASSSSTAWIDIYGRVLGANAGNIGVLNGSAAANNSTTFQLKSVSDAGSDTTGVENIPGTKSYTANKGLVYYTKITGSTQKPLILEVAEYDPTG